MYIGESYPITYFARDKKTGLTSVVLLVERPDGVNEGLFNMVEFDPVNHAGEYRYNYTPMLEGIYGFRVAENGIWQATNQKESKDRQGRVPYATFD